MKPNFNDLMMNPARAQLLSAEEAGMMLAKLAGVQTVLMGRVLSSSGNDKESSEDTLLDVKQASERLNCTTVWLYRNSKKLPFTKRLSPRQLRFSSKGIDKYLKSRPQ